MRIANSDAQLPRVSALSQCVATLRHLACKAMPVKGSNAIGIPGKAYTHVEGLPVDSDNSHGAWQRLMCISLPCDWDSGADARQPLSCAKWAAGVSRQLLIVRAGLLQGATTTAP